MSSADEVIESWAWMKSAFETLGLGGSFEVDRLGGVQLVIELGAGWGATITTERGDLRGFHPIEDPISVVVWGGDRSHPSFVEGYTVKWYAERDDPPRVPELIAPLLRRLKAEPETFA